MDLITFRLIILGLIEDYHLDRKRRGYAKAVSALGGLFVTLGLVTYVLFNVFSALDLSGASAVVNTTVAAISSSAIRGLLR